MSAASTQSAIDQHLALRVQIADAARVTIAAADTQSQKEKSQ